MTVPTNILDAIDAYAATEYARGKADQSITDAGALSALTAENDQLHVALDSAEADLAALQTQFDQYKADHPDTTPPPPPPPSTIPLVGASKKGNGDIVPTETFCGRAYGLHRTYWDLSEITSAITMCKADHAKGRIPFVSFKFGSTSWASVAGGSRDADIKNLTTQIASLTKPVWAAFHHEPEGDGVMTDWVKMQQHLWPLLGTKNLIPFVIYTGGDHFTSTTDPLDGLYPTGTKFNIGIDGYNRYGDANHPTSGWTEMKTKFYDKVAPEAVKRGVGWAIAETGYTDAAAAKDADWLTRAFDDMKNHPVLPGMGLSYFDSDANSNGTWPLGTGIKRDKFKAILNRSHALV